MLTSCPHLSGLCLECSCIHPEKLLTCVQCYVESTLGWIHTCSSWHGGSCRHHGGRISWPGAPPLSPTSLYTGASGLSASHHRVQLMSQRISRRKFAGWIQRGNPCLQLRVDTPLKGSPCCHHMLQQRSRMRMFFFSLCKTHLLPRSF